jgi:hypothetical protein
VFVDGRLLWTQCIPQDFELSCVIWAKSKPDVSFSEGIMSCLDSASIFSGNGHGMLIVFCCDRDVVEKFGCHTIKAHKEEAKFHLFLLFWRN